MSAGSATKGKGRISVIASTSQVFISGAVFFVVFRFLYDSLGIEVIGIWSLVLATTSMSRIGELGLSAGVVRYVAQALSRGDGDRAARIVETVTVTLAVLMGVLLLLVYPACKALIGYLVPSGRQELAVGILPYALVSLWINIAASVFSGALDGCHRIDLRCLSTGAAHLLFLVLVLAFAGPFGLAGVALAQLLQAAVLAVASWLFLRRELPGLQWLPVRWNGGLMREMIGYGVSFQSISIMNLLFEPVAKALLGKFGGLASLGHYEMANKLLLQGRAVIVEAGRILVPSVASMASAGAGAVRELFVTSYRFTFFVSVLFYGMLGTILAGISIIWIGHLEPEFLLYALLLNVGWFVNTLIGPAYFSNLGSGAMRQNVLSHVILGLVASVAGWWFGSLYGGLGVVAGTALGLVVGSGYLLISYLRAHGFSWVRFIVPSGSIVLVIVAVALCVLTQAWALNGASVFQTLVSGVIAALALAAAGWFHPLRASLLGAARR